VIRLAARELAELGQQAETAVPALAQLVRHSDPEVRLDVVLALAEIGAGATVAASTLFDVLEHDDDARVRAWAVSGLAAARNTRWEARAIAQVTHALEDDDSGIRYNAICALRSLGPAARVAVPALQRIACGENGFHAEAARNTLASLAG
jgi:HEAT repeat protein